MTATEGRAWSSSLSTNDFASCIEAGYQPVGFVQGCSVISWGWGSTMTAPLGMGYSGTTSTRGYSEQFACPHGFVGADHRLYGLNYEQDWAEDAWRLGFSSSYQRLVDEAARLSAHGVIALVDRVIHDPDTATYRFTIEGTAVRVAGAPDTKALFTTYLAGQKLNKLLEAGYAPVSVVAEFVSIQVFASCITEYLLQGRGAVGWGQSIGGELDQLSRAHEAARHVARERVRAGLGSDLLHAAHLEVSERELTGSGPQINVMLKGNRVRRFKAYEPLPPPRPVVRLVD
ncbi:MAG: hypothetical protein WCF24_00745 [Acidimicrobiales bacterium]